MAFGNRGFFAVGVFTLIWGSFVFASGEPPWPLPLQFESKAPRLPRSQAASTEKLTSQELAERAARAEKSGDWEGAFAAYCEAFGRAGERDRARLRLKVNASLRRVQQVRRHRDAGYLQFVRGLASIDAVNLYAEVTAKAPGMFADPVRATPQNLWTSGIEELDRALASPVFRQAFLEPSSGPRVEAFRKQLRAKWAKRSIADSRSARSSLKRLLAAAQDAFALRTPSALAIEFVHGACSGLDEYTVFLNPSQLTESPAPALDLSAYGILLRFENGSLIVEGVIPGSWASFHAPQARKGDRVARINGQPMVMVNPESLAGALRSAVNGVHEVEIEGLEESPVRLPATLPTVWHRMLGSKDGIGYIRIGEFHTATPHDLDIALASLKSQEVRVILLDLRGNRGGSFLAAVEVAKRFLPAGLIVTTQGQIGEVANRSFSSDFGMRAADVPVVVLLDSATASAAEVVAAALRDNNPRGIRAVLVGMPTFGKGTIQYPLKLAAADGADETGKPRRRSGAVRLTIARLIAPNGKAINGVGIAPEFLVADPAMQWEVAIERALELLQPRPSPMPPIALPPS